MKFSVFWLEFAENKLDDIYSYYSEKAGEKTAQKLVKGIIECTTSLQYQPEVGQVEFLLKEREEEFRYLVFKNYKIVYWVNTKTQRVEIANVFDTRQNPQKLKDAK